MRNIEYLSPSSISKFYDDLEEFYMTYLAETKAPRFAQTRPMSIGSAFDAYVKSFLHEQLFGKANDSRFELRTLFEAQVEPHNRDWAWEHGQEAFTCYKRSGALADLMVDLQGSIGTPRFEFEVKGAIDGYREGVTKQMEGGIILLGKPDVFYINKHGCHVILDFKVNGWCSKSAVSPMKGYLKIRSGSGVAVLQGPHKDCLPMAHQGTIINAGQFLNDCNEDWARQLSIYAWLVGCNIGDEFIAAIDQVVCKPVGMKYPEVRIAEHRLRIHKDFQWKTFAAAQHVWEVVHSDYVFRHLSKHESQDKCTMLETQAKALAKPESVEDQIFNQMTRPR